MKPFSYNDFAYPQPKDTNMTDDASILTNHLVDAWLAKDARTQAAILEPKIISFFESRGGFDHWWDDIDSEIQDEVRSDLQEMIRKVLAP